MKTPSSGAPGASALPPVLQLQSVSAQRGARPVFSGLNASFARGSLTAIIGPNGAGKSTLLDVLAGRLAPSQGQVRRQEGLSLALLAQQSTIDRSFPVRVSDVVALGAWSRIGLWKAMSGGLRREVSEALRAVGLPGSERRSLAELSVGQFQRVLFARLMLQNAEVMLLDEPFNAVDEQTTADLLALVQQWRAQGRTVIAVLHDIEQVRAHFDHTVWLSPQGATWGPTADMLAPRRWPLTMPAATAEVAVAEGWA